MCDLTEEDFEEIQDDLGESLKENNRLWRQIKANEAENKRLRDALIDAAMRMISDEWRDKYLAIAEGVE